MAGATIDGWITDDGVMLTADGADLRRFPRIELRGETDFSLLDKVPEVHAELQEPGHTGKPLPARLVAGGRAYTITVDLKPEEVPDAPSLVVRLTFDTSFCPRERLPKSRDPRRLVVKAAGAARLARGP
jgi:hypothetical protein